MSRQYIQAFRAMLKKGVSKNRVFWGILLVKDTLKRFTLRQCSPGKVLQIAMVTCDFEAFSKTLRIASITGDFEAFSETLCISQFQAPTSHLRADPRGIF